MTIWLVTRPASPTPAQAEPQARTELPAASREPRQPKAVLEAIHEAKQLCQGGSPNSACVHYVIATIPDPGRGPLAVYTDEALSAISQAAVDAGFLLHTHVLPWRPKREAGDKKLPSDTGFEVSGELLASSARVTVSEEDAGALTRTLHQVASAAPLEGTAAVSFDARVRPEAQRPSQLGALIYKRPETSELLVVLVVGESAVKGVDLATLREALDLVQCTSAKQPVTFPVIGPFFSGSASALWRVLNGTKEECQLQIKSGSATGELFEDRLAARHHFERTLVTDRELSHYLFEKLSELNPLAKVAVLTESGTQYASGYSSIDEAKLELKFRSYTFPMHVAALRSAYGSRESAADERLAGLRRSLDIDLSTVHPENQDQIPVYSELTPLSVDATLRGTFDNIARWGAHYLLVVATDPADLIFLAGQARDYVPGAQLITVSSSALYGHASFAPELRGALVASSYPLGLDNQNWEYRRLKKLCRGLEGRCRNMSMRNFPSDGAQGIYNAMHELIRSNRSDLPNTARLDVTAPGVNGVATRPWLTLISGRAWALDFQGSDVSSDTHGTRAFVRPTHFAIGWAIAILGLCAFQALMVYLAAFGGAQSKRFFRAFTWPTPQTSAIVVQYQATAYFALGMFGVATAIAARHTFNVERLWTHPITEPLFLTTVALSLLLPAAAVCLTALGLIVPIAWLFRREAHTPDRYAAAVQWIVGFVIAALVIATSVSLCSFASTLASNVGPLLLLRVTDPLGPSPLAVLFFPAFGLYFWAVTGLARAGAIARFTPEAPCAGIHFRFGVRLSDNTEPGMRQRTMIWEIGLVLALVAPIVLLWMRILPTFEWPLFDMALKLLLLTLTCCVMFACLQASLFWSRLRGVLEEQAAMPTIEAFNRIASKVAGSFGTQLRSHVPPPHELVVSVQSLETLCSFGPQLDREEPVSARILARLPGLRTCLEDLQRAYERRRNVNGGAAPSWPMRVLVVDERAAHRAFFQASNTLNEILTELYTTRAQNPRAPELENASVDLLAEGRLSQSPTGFVIANGLPAKTLLWIRGAEDFVAMRIVTWAYHVLAQIRWLIIFALFGAVMLVCTAVSYPLHPQRFVTLFCGSSLLWVAAVTLRLLLQLQATEILRRLAPGPQLSGLRVDMLRQVTTYVVLPVLVLAARVFPELADNLGRMLEPLVTLLQ